MYTYETFALLLPTFPCPSLSMLICSEWLVAKHFPKKMATLRREGERGYFWAEGGITVWESGFDISLS